MTFIHTQVEAARSGAAPDLICRLPSGWLMMCQMQFLRGYCIQLPDPVVGSLNDLLPAARVAYLSDMALIGDALMEVTGAYRINYGIMGNSDPALHSHIVPRYLDEPEHLLHGLPWSYPKAQLDGVLFERERDLELMQQIAKAIRSRTG